MSQDNQTPQNSKHDSSNVSSDAASTNPRVQFKLPAWAKAAILVAVVALASVGYLTSTFMHKSNLSGGAAAETDPEELAKRKAVTDFILTEADGKQKKLSEYRGNVVILSFWASWCTPCLVELPTFAELEKRFHDDGLRIVAVNVDEGEEGKVFAKDFWGKNKFPFPSYFDTNKALAQQFEVDMLPSNFVIDRQGRLVFSGFGANDWNSEENVEFIEGLLQESMQDPKPQGDGA